MIFNESFTIKMAFTESKTVHSFNAQDKDVWSNRLQVVDLTCESQTKL